MTSTITTKGRRYGHLALAEKIQLYFWMNVLPWNVLYHLILASESKPWRRIACESIARFTTRRFPIFAPQYLLNSSVHIYGQWARHHGFPREVDVLPDDARLMWVGPKPKSLDHVILFVHGGGFICPMADFTHNFLLHIKSEIERTRGITVGMCALAYNLIPAARFPSQLRDAHAAVDFLLQSGVHASKLQLLGESAGGTIILQLLRHIMHPHPVVEPLPRDTLFAGVCVISPGLPVLDEDDVEGKRDLIDLDTIRKFGDLLTCEVLESDMYYLKPTEGFLEGLEARVMITSGTGELMASAHGRLRDELARCADTVDLTWVADEGGIHCGPVFDFPMSLFPGKPYIGDTTRKVVDWLGEGFNAVLTA